MTVNLNKGEVVTVQFLQGIIPELGQQAATMISFLLYHAQIPCNESETMNDTKICFCTW